MPTYTWLHVEAHSDEVVGEAVRPLIPYVAQNVCGLQDPEPLRSILISGKRGTSWGSQCLCMDHADVDLDGYVPITYRMSIPARLTITATAKNWPRGVDTGIIDALLTLLPVDSVSTFIAHYAQLSEESGSAKRQGGPCLNRYTRFPSQSKHSRRC